MIKSYKNVLPKPFFNKLLATVSDNNFPWYFQENTVDISESKNNFMFTHLLAIVDPTITGDSPMEEKSRWFKTFEPIQYFIDKEFKIKKLMRMKLNLYTNQQIKIKHEDHVDYPTKMNQGIKTAIFNFTNCNGGTSIKGKIIKSKANELHIFNNEVKHFGIVQTDTPVRMLLNINWK